MNQTCKCCGTSLNQDFEFCPNCGAKWVEDRLTVKAFITDFFHRVTNFEGPLYQTLIDLTIHVDTVTNGYINGVRKKYISPSRYLLISITLSGILLYAFKDQLDAYYEVAYRGGLGASGSEDLPEMGAFGKKFQAMMSVYEKNMNLVGFFILPVLSAFSYWMLNKKKQFNFAEHLVVNTYLYAHTSIIGGLVGLIIYYVAGRDFSIWLQISTVFSFSLTAWFLHKSLARNFFLALLSVIITYAVFSILLGIIMLIIALAMP